MKKKKEILEGSRAIALTIKNIEPSVISAYPITPQTHIVEDLAKIKADGMASYEYIRAESEFAAASIVLGASATGVRSYSATSSQGLLLMAEVVYNIAGSRLPVVITLANRALSAPISIWNDHQDAMAVRDAGWLMFFAENNQEAIEQHLLAYKIAEKRSLPAFVNVDGFILTHCYEPVYVPDKKTIKRFLPAYKPKKESFLDAKNPITLGAFMTPAHYQETRKKIVQDMNLSISDINKEYFNLQKILYKKTKEKNNNGMFEYIGPKKAKIILIAMGSVVGTIKEAVRKEKGVGVLKIKTYRPFPGKEIYDIIKESKNVAIIEKSISPGSFSPLFLDVKAVKKDGQNIKSFLGGLGGRDIKEEDVIKIIKNFKNLKEVNFI
jgi:pyruvate ferredoxin oxidoreductase alpha subunit